MKPDKLLSAIYRTLESCGMKWDRSNQSNATRLGFERCYEIDGYYAEAKDHFDILISFYRHDEPKTLRKHEENYINNLALGKIIMIDNRQNTSLIRVAAE